MSIWLRKRSAGAASGGYEWSTDGAVTEVPDEIGLELLDRPGGEFTAVDPPASPPQEAKADRAAREVAETPAPKTTTKASK